MPGLLILIFVGLLAAAGLVSKAIFARQVGHDLGSRTELAPGLTEYRVPVSRAMAGITVASVSRDCQGCGAGGGANIVVTKQPRNGRVELIQASTPSRGPETRTSTDLMYTARAASEEPDEVVYRVWTSRTEFVEHRVLLAVR